MTAIKYNKTPYERGCAERKQMWATYGYWDARVMHPRRTRTDESLKDTKNMHFVDYSLTSEGCCLFRETKR